MLTAPEIKKRINFAIYLLLVLLLHLIFLLQQIHLTNSTSQIEPATSQDPIKVTFVPPATSSMKKIVRSEESESTEKKENSYLSDKDRSFNRQTRARKVDLFEKAAQGTDNLPQAGTNQTGEHSPVKKLSLSKLGAAAGDAQPLRQAAREYAQAKQGVKSGDPSSSRGISSTNDYIDEVALGDLTQLNTVEFKYYGFYHRIRQKLEQFWGRSIQEKAEELFEGGRRIPANEEHVTSLQVVISKEGKILDIKVQGSSGVREFDDAAVESFNQAGPFPNPPQDLVVDGKVVIHFGFLVRS